MEISIVQNEIEEAISDYLSKKIRLAEDQVFKIDLTATRGASGFTASISIEKTPLCEETSSVEPVQEATVEQIEVVDPKPSMETYKDVPGVAKKSFFANLT